MHMTEEQVGKGLLEHLGPRAAVEEFVPLERSSDGRFECDRSGVRAVLATRDRKVEFILFETHVLAHVRSAMGYPAYYPVLRSEVRRPVKAVLMDLDGTSVRSEEFWTWIIELTTGSLIGDRSFQLEEADMPFVSGHSVSEHLRYCVQKYCPGETVERARELYFQHTHFQMQEILQGRGRKGAFKPSAGLKAFLLELKARGVKIGLVTSGLYEKAWPEIVSAFQAMDLGDPRDFYDAVITAGFPMRPSHPGTLGELAPKPHPWLYAEVCRVGLGIHEDERCHVVGIEDSGAGVCAVRLAGFGVIGYAHGNIVQSGTSGLCNYFCSTFRDISTILFDQRR